MTRKNKTVLHLRCAIIDQQYTRFNPKLQSQTNNCGMDPKLQLLLSIMQQQSNNSHVNSNYCCPHHPRGPSARAGNVVPLGTQYSSHQYHSTQDACHVSLPDQSHVHANIQSQASHKTLLMDQFLHKLQSSTNNTDNLECDDECDDGYESFGGSPMLSVEPHQQRPHQNKKAKKRYINPWQLKRKNKKKKNKNRFIASDESGTDIDIDHHDEKQNELESEEETPLHVITLSASLSINGEIIYQYGPATIIFSPLFVDRETDVKKQKSSIMIKEKENENVNENEIIYDDIKIDHEDIKSEKKKKKNKEKLPILPGGAPLMRQFDYNRNFERIRGRNGYTKTFLTMILSETLSIYTGLQRYISKNQRETYLHPWTVYTNVAENVVFDVGLCWTGRAITICPLVLRGQSGISYSEAVKKAYNALQMGRFTKYGKCRNTRYVYALDGQLFKFGANQLTLLSISPQQPEQRQ